MTPMSSTALMLCLLLYAHTLLPRSRTTLSLSIISIHPSLVRASQQGSGCCMRGILGLWRQFENEARLHLNTLLSGHLVNLMRGG